MKNNQQDANHFWHQAFFADHQPHSLPASKQDSSQNHPKKIGVAGELWLTRLFAGTHSDEPPNADKLRIYKEGVIVDEIPLHCLGQETRIGRHPDADLRLEADKMAMFHALIVNREGVFYIKDLDAHVGVLVNHKKLKFDTLMPLVDGMQIDMPGYRLEFFLANAQTVMDESCLEADEQVNRSNVFYKEPAPPPTPLLPHLVAEGACLSLWRGGSTQLKVVAIIEETADCKTFRLAGVEPLLFSYKPGQFIIFTLTIAGQEVRRSYSLSSSPSRPNLLEMTIKRVPDGLVSNWFCDHVKVGDLFDVKGFFGKFSCFTTNDTKMLFVGAGSGITPLLSMCRWIADTAADVNVKVLASFKTPEDIIFRKEFELLAARHRNFQIAITLTAGWQGTEGWTGFTGRVNESMLKLVVPDLCDYDVFLCGPEPFAEHFTTLLRTLNYPLSRLHTESFGSGRSAAATQEVAKTLALKGVLHKVTFTKSGKTVDADEHITLLELAEAHGIALDCSCRAGSCGECEVKCKGEVSVTPFCEIDAKTKNAGFIYSCCSMAASDLELDC